MVSLIEYGVGCLFVAVFEDAQQIARHVGVNCCGAIGACVFDRDDGIEFVDIEIDELRGISGRG